MQNSAKPTETVAGTSESTEQASARPPRVLESFGIANIHRSRAKLWPKSRLLVESPVWLAGSISSRGMIGAYTFLRDTVRLSGNAAHIGRYCSIAPGVIIGDSNHPTDWLSTHSFQWGDGQWIPSETFRNFSTPKEKKKAHTVIGSDVWIGANAIILSNITIGNGAIIAAGSVVSRDVPPYAIVGGIPARVIRYRFDEQTIARLMKIRWWRFRPDDLFDIPFNDIHATLDELEKRMAAGKLREIETTLYEVTPDGITKTDNEKSVALFNRRISSGARKAAAPAQAVSGVSEINGARLRTDGQIAANASASPTLQIRVSERIRPALIWLGAFLSGLAGAAVWQFLSG